MTHQSITTGQSLLRPIPTEEFLLRNFSFSPLPFPIIVEHLSTNKGKQLSDIEEKSRNTVLFASTVCVIDWSATTPLFLFHCTRSASVGFPESTTALYSPEDPRNERAAPIDGPRRERDRPLHEDPPRFGVGRNENETKCSGGQATERARPSGWGKSKPRVLEGASVLLERGRERTKERERESRQSEREMGWRSSLEEESA